MTFKLAEGRASNPNQKRGSLTVVLDGYNAPVSAGNFVDLVQRKFYDGMEVQRSDGFVVQSVRNPHGSFVAAHASCAHAAHNHRMR
jgi:cyclophilin family peptidyl-prolyl cis-trans isomerase